MTDPLDDRLTSAGRVLNEDPEVSSALHALSDARAADARTTRRRRILLPSIVIGTVLAFSGAGAVVATQWQPWEMADPDLVVAQTWTDVSGNYLGSCETWVAATAVSPSIRTEMGEYLDSLDVENIQPNPEVVAGLLLAVGRPDDVGRLVPGAVASDFDTHRSGVQWPIEWFTDARILQDGLMHEVFAGLYTSLAGNGQDVKSAIANMETQCTTDPTRTGGQ